MSDLTRRIGLSLGADLCWPIAYTEILDRLDLGIPDGDDRVRFEVERVSIEPFELRRASRYDLVVDRLTHWYDPTREWIKKLVIIDQAYVFNNPWTVQSMEKQTTYCALMRLGFPIPETWLIPPKEYEESADLHVTLERYARLFDLKALGREVGFPLFLKPYDGGGWKAVSKVDDEDALERAYDESGRLVMHMQAAVQPFDAFVRCVGLGPQTRLVRYDPGAPLHDRYTVDPDPVGPGDAALLRSLTLIINAFFGWDFNSCECLRRDGVWHPIDFANPCPDSQVTSLHFHFPWLIKANLRWSIFAAATRRPMRLDLEWHRYFDAVEPDMTIQERVDALLPLALERFEVDRFDEFCDTHLGHLDEVAHEFFGTEQARDAVRLKVASLYPDHEVDEFTALFWERIQDWRREDEASR